MRLLFELDAKDYNREGSVFIRPSVRGILLREGKAAMVHSLKYDYYKFPGGGIEPGETQEQALIREAREEAGLIILPGSVRAYGYVHRIQKGDREDVFIQDNFYYFCEALPETSAQQLDDYEAQERFTLEFIRPGKAIAVNRSQGHGPCDPLMIEREALVLERLVSEGFLHR